MRDDKRGELIVAPFGDDTQIIFPDKPIDCSRLGYFDELEIDCWHLIKKYAEWFGIKITPEEEISWNVAKEIQDLILEWFKGAGVRFHFDAAVSEETSRPTYEVRIAALEEKASRIGAKFEHNFYDKDHLFCFWYDGFDVATIEYKNHLVSFDVHGDIEIGVEVKNDVIPLRHRGGSQSLYHDTDCREIIPDDQALHDLIVAGRVNYEANNWIGIMVTDLDTDKYVCEPEIGDVDDLLDVVENSFDFWINYIDNLVDKK